MIHSQIKYKNRLKRAVFIFGKKATLKPKIPFSIVNRLMIGDHRL